MARAFAREGDGAPAGRARRWRRLPLTSRRRPASRTRWSWTPATRPPSARTRPTALGQGLLTGKYTAQVPRRLRRWRSSRVETLVSADRHRRSSTKGSPSFAGSSATPTTTSSDWRSGHAWTARSTPSLSSGSHRRPGSPEHPLPVRAAPPSARHRPGPSDHAGGAGARHPRNGLSRVRSRAIRGDAGDSLGRCARTWYRARRRAIGREGA